jgi:predicted HAD superfamily Cof-like phosphohydrolase
MQQQLDSILHKLNTLESMVTAPISTPQKSEAAQVREFTMGCGRSCPDKPSLMTYDEAKFLIGMMLSEIVELAQTVTSGPDQAVELVRGLVTVDLKRNYVKPTDEIDLIAQQADAAVDCAYYAYDAFVKKGINLRSIFNVVHKANMDKRFPDGTFHKRDDGKIIKPPNWQEPDIRGEVERQKREGAWA